MLTLSAILAIVITILAALHISYTVTVNSIIPKVTKSKQIAQQEAAKQAAINEAMITFMKNAGADTTKITNK